MTPDNGASVVLLAGDRQGGFADGVGTAAKFNAPGGLAMLGGDVLVADTQNHRLRRMTPDGDVRTVAGTGEGNDEDASVGSSVTLNAPGGVDVKDGKAIVADTNSNSIRQIDPSTGSAVTLAPRKGFSKPRDVAIDRGGGIYVAEADAGWVRKLNGGDRPTVITKGLSEPWGIAFGPDGSMYVTDYGKQRIRRVTRSGRHQTIAGTGEYGTEDGRPGRARFGRPAAITTDSRGFLYVADLGTHRIRVVSPQGVVATLAGGDQGFDDGPAALARFDNPRGIAVTLDGSTVYVADRANNAIRKITGFDAAKLTQPPVEEVRRDVALARGIPVECAANDRGRCRIQVLFGGKVFTTRETKLTYIGRKTLTVRLPAAARESVRRNPETRFEVRVTFTGPVGPQKQAPYTLVAR